MKQQRLFIACLGLSLLIGCAGQSKIPTPEENDSAPSVSADGVADTAANSVIPTDNQAIDEETALLSQLVLYFNFDQSDVGAEFRKMLAAHARRLADNPAVSLSIEGHADERGSREYNIGLGERRAQAVRRLLLLEGAPQEQLGTFSFGEEQPAVSGGDENSWSLNRRVELVYQSVTPPLERQ